MSKQFETPLRFAVRVQKDAFCQLIAMFASHDVAAADAALRSIEQRFAQEIAAEQTKSAEWDWPPDAFAEVSDLLRASLAGARAEMTPTDRE